MHQKWQLTGSRMTLEVCQMGVRRAVSRKIWSLLWFFCFIYVALSSSAQLPGVFIHPIAFWEERMTMHKGPQKCSCSVNCWIAKLRVFLNYYSILFLKLISFLGRRCFCKDFGVSGVPSECRSWSYSHWIQLERIWSSGAFHRIFMHLKARTMLKLNGKSDFQRMEFDTSFQTTCELF